MYTVKDQGKINPYVFANITKMLTLLIYTVSHILITKQCVFKLTERCLIVYFFQFDISPKLKLKHRFYYSIQ